MKWILVGAMCVLALLLTAYLALNRQSESISFDQEGWLLGEEDNESPYIRLEMVNDLIEHHLALGMSKSQVATLLGPATDTEKFNDFDFVYWLGVEQAFAGIDSTWLVLKFDEANMLIEHKMLDD